MPLTTIKSSNIKDAEVKDVDISPTAAIASRKISGLDTTQLETNAFNIGILGFKIAVNDGFNIIFEYSFRKTFSDYLDDVSTTYPNAGLTDITTDSYEMSDPNYNSSDPASIFPSNAERGDPCECIETKTVELDKLLASIEEHNTSDKLKEAIASMMEKWEAALKFN